MTAPTLTPAQRRVLVTAAARSSGHVCPTIGLHGSAQTALLKSLLAQGFITERDPVDGSLAPTITPAGRAVLEGVSLNIDELPEDDAVCDCEHRWARGSCPFCPAGGFLPPCPRCLALARDEHIRAEMVHPLPLRFAPLARDGTGPCCRDCAAADTLLAMRCSVPGFLAARIAVGNDRQEQLRLPGVLMGLVKLGIVQPSKSGDLERHHRWLDAHQWFGIRSSEET